MGWRRSQRPGPSPTLGSLGPSHHWRHKSRVSLRGPPCALGVSGIPYGEVRDKDGFLKYKKSWVNVPQGKLRLLAFNEKYHSLIVGHRREKHSP
jgi:hypothetical protein